MSPYTTSERITASLGLMDAPVEHRSNVRNGWKADVTCQAEIDRSLRFNSLQSFPKVHGLRASCLGDRC